MSNQARDSLLELLKPEGLLVQRIRGFEPRQEQRKMVETVFEAFATESVALIEAGTGTGKSLGYLLPACIWAYQTKERVLVSTHTISLQEQLLEKEIPSLLQAIGVELKVALVKGMQNYLCLRKLEEMEWERSFFSTDMHVEAEALIQFAKKSKGGGTRSQLPFVVSQGCWERVKAESESCERQECQHYASCYFFKARREAQDAQVLLVNHHLFALDVAKRAASADFGEAAVLPAYQRVIVDEAHHLERVAAELFAQRLSRQELLQLLHQPSHEGGGALKRGCWLNLGDIFSTYKKYCSAQEMARWTHTLSTELPAIRGEVVEAVHRFFDVFLAWSTLRNSTEIEDSKWRILPEQRKQLFWQETLLPTSEKLQQTLRKFIASLSSLEMEVKQVNSSERWQEQTKGVQLDLQGLCRRLEEAVFFLREFLEEKEPERVRWLEAERDGVRLVDAHLDLAPFLASYLFSKIPTTVLCSATLTDGKGFAFVREKLGLTESLLPQKKVIECTVESPFCYQEQVLLAVPTDLPLPDHPQFLLAASQSIERAIQVSGGQVFVLFTSYGMLQKVAERLGPALAAQGFTLLQQGSRSRQHLLKDFKTGSKRVLFGTDSFWEGVDVVGDALRCVILVKLPFPSPNDPMGQARAEQIKKTNKDPFIEDTLPRAIVKFKQGFGRLIRSRYDRGCILCLDTRLLIKSYGQRFFRSLPASQTAFLPQEQLFPKIELFYRDTEHFVRKQSTSQI